MPLPKHVFVATCSSKEELHFAHIDSIVALCCALQERGTLNFSFRCKDTSRDAAVMRAIHEFLSNPKCEKLVLIDGDVYVNPSTIIAMLELDHDVVVCGVPQAHINWQQVGIVAMKGALQALPIAGSTYMLTADPAKLGDDGTVPIFNTLPLGCVVIKREVFYTLADAHPELACQMPDSALGTTMYALFMPLIENGIYLRPDLAFAKRLHDAGIKLRMLVTEAPSRIGSIVFPGNMNPTLLEVAEEMNKAAEEKKPPSEVAEAPSEVAAVPE